MQVLLVLNEYSRLGQREGTSVCDALERANVVCVRDPQAADVQAVVAAGGDGTVIGAIPLALARGVPLGIVPLGTFNDLARTLGIPTDIKKASKVIVSAHTRA